MSETASDLAIPTIELPGGLSARLMQIEHAEAMFCAMQDSPAIRSYITWTAGLAGVEDVQLAIETFRANGELRYAVEDPQFAGYLGAVASPDRDHEYEIGYCVVAQKRGRGYAKLAASGLMFALWENHDARSFSLYINDANAASIAVAASLGFERTDETRREEKLDSWERRYERIALHE
jgi:RimJ/RimL family protein N-acetyltransferase